MVTRTLCAHLSVLPAAFLATPPAGEGGPQGESTLYRCSLNEFIGGDELQVLLFHHLNLPASIRFLSCFFHLFFFFLLLDCKSFLYISDINFLSNIWFANIFSPFVRLSFCFVAVFLCCQQHASNSPSFPNDL